MVDDAVVMRRLISSVLEAHPDLEVVGTAASGMMALTKIPQCNPDLVTMDVEMPDMDGLQTVSEIHRLYPKLPVIMFSTLTQRGAVQTVEALARGAVDYVAKPANVGNVQEAVARLNSDLVPKILACVRPARLPANIGRPAPLGGKSQLGTNKRVPSGIVAIGCSTGGPNALHCVVPLFPENLSVPVVMVQHMPAGFTSLLAKRLSESSPLRVDEVVDGQEIESGRVYLAPGGRHFELRAKGTSIVAHLHDGPPENSCRPAVDVLFRSVAAIYGPRSLGVVLTGMGQDGLRGSRSIREAGGQILVQDRESSVVWGMPGSVAEAQLADEILDLHAIAPAILSRCTKEVMSGAVRG